MFFAWMSWQSETSKKCYFFLLRSIFRLVFLSHYKFKFFHYEISLKNNTLAGVLRWKIVDFVRCKRVLTVQNFQKNLLSIIFLDIQIHPPLSPITTGFLSFIKVLMKSFLVVRNFSMVKLLIFSLHWKTDLPIFQIMLVIMFYLDIETLNSF